MVQKGTTGVVEASPPALCFTQSDTLLVAMQEPFTGEKETHVRLSNLRLAELTFKGDMLFELDQKVHQARPEENHMREKIEKILDVCFF